MQAPATLLSLADRASAAEALLGLTAHYNRSQEITPNQAPAPPPDAGRFPVAGRERGDQIGGTRPPPAAAAAAAARRCPSPKAAAAVAVGGPLSKRYLCARPWKSPRAVGRPLRACKRRHARVDHPRRPAAHPRLGQPPGEYKSVAVQNNGGGDHARDDEAVGPQAHALTPGLQVLVGHPAAPAGEAVDRPRLPHQRGGTGRGAPAGPSDPTNTSGGLEAKQEAARALGLLVEAVVGRMDRASFFVCMRERRRREERAAVLCIIRAWWRVCESRGGGRRRAGRGSQRGTSRRPPRERSIPRGELQRPVL